MPPLLEGLFKLFLFLSTLSFPSSHPMQPWLGDFLLGALHTVLELSSLLSLGQEPCCLSSFLEDNPIQLVDS